MQSGAGNDFVSNPLFNQQMQQSQQPQQGLPAQGMQMGHFPVMNNQLAQQSILAQRRQQQQQHLQLQQQQQQQQIQAHKQQMMQSQQNRTGLPPTITQQAMPNQIAQQLANQIAQRPMMQNVRKKFIIEIKV